MTNEHEPLYRPGVVISDLKVQGGGEMVAYHLARHFGCPLYTLRYDPQGFTNKFHETIKDQIVVISDKGKFSEDEIEVALDDDVPQAQSMCPTSMSLNAVDLTDFNQIFVDYLIAVDNVGARMAQYSDRPYFAYLHHAAKGFTDYFFEQLDAPRSFRSAFSFVTKRYRHIRQAKHANRNATHVMPNSVLTRQRAHEVFKLPYDQMTVVYPPVDTETYTPGEAESFPYDFDRYFVAPQRLEAYKNINVLIEAAKRAKEHLVLVGNGRMEDYVRRESEYSDYIHSLGYVPDEILRDVYRGATATLQGTMREDFGIVPVESLACGTPCILPDSGGFKETVGAGYAHDEVSPYQTEYGLMMDPETFDVVTLSEALQEFDPDDYDPETCRARAEQFSIQRFMSQVTDVMNEHIEDVDVTKDST